MSISLQKGQKISLTKDNPGLSEVVVGLGWDEVKKGLFGLGGGQDIDCDASIFALKNGRLASSEDIVYYHNLRHSSGAIMHCGDNLTGAGDGDDEQIIVNLKNLPNDYDKLVVVVNIYSANARKQEFGMIKNAFMRIVDKTTNKELMRYDLTENYKGYTAVIFGELYKKNGEWKLSAIGQGSYANSISELAKTYQ